MDMDGARRVEEWSAGRLGQCLGRVRLAGMAAAAALLLAAGWTAWREVAVRSLPGVVQARILAQENLGTTLTLKRIALTAHLAKVRGNVLLYDLTRPLGPSACEGLDDYRSLPGDHPCRNLWKAQIALIWQTAFDGDGPSLGPEILADRWGSPYLLDMSEISCGLHNAWCPTDSLRSAGADGKLDTDDDIMVSLPQHVKRDFKP